MAYETREQWLQAATTIFDKELLAPAGHPLPSVRVSCGFAKGGGEAIGQCWYGDACVDGKTVNVFVCPTQGEPLRVLDILLHELVHAAIGPGHGHKGPFRKLATKVGLEGKMTATVAEPQLLARLKTMLTELGEYPHKGLRPGTRKAKRPGGGGWLRLMSTNNEEYRVLISPKQLEEHGVPQDPWGDEMVEAD